MYTNTQKQSSSFSPISSQKKDNVSDSSSAFLAQRQQDIDSSSQKERPSYSRNAADALIANVMPSMEAREQGEEASEEGKDSEEMSLRTGIQTKLTVGAVGDKYEQEADQVAAQVMSISVAPNNSPQVQRFGEEDNPVQRWSLAQSITPHVQRQVDEQVQMRQLVQRAFQAGGNEAPGDLENRLNASRGGGSSLAPSVRAFMEPRFGADFSRVRVHTGGLAVQMNRELGAQAFAHGSDVYFGAGKSPGNNQLTAHELTHVVQQNGGISKIPEIQTQSYSNVVQLKIIKIGTEKVNVANGKDENEARRIIKNLKNKYGIDLSSPSGVNAIKKDYPDAPGNVKDSLKTKEWEFKELQALEKALMHFAPILGTRRKASSRAGKDQEITSASKVDQAIDADDPSGVLDNTTLGEYFESSKNFSMFSAGTNSKEDFKDNKKQLEGTVIHEIAHGLLKYALNDYVKALDYWTDEDTKSGKAGAENPITEYGKTNADEDLSEAVMYYFVEAKTLQKKCPKRYEFIKQIIKNWTKKKNNP